MALDHTLTWDATREGARTARPLATAAARSDAAPPEPERFAVDPAITAAVHLGWTARVPFAMLLQRIDPHLKAGTDGSELGPVNVWVWNTGTGAFVPDAARQSWTACSRNNGGTNPDYLGVSLGYSYHLQTPLGNLLSIVTIGMHDQTVMRLNPTNQ